MGAEPGLSWVSVHVQVGAAPRCGHVVHVLCVGRRCPELCIGPHGCGSEVVAVSQASAVVRRGPERVALPWRSLPHPTLVLSR